MKTTFGGFSLMPPENRASAGHPPNISFYGLGGQIITSSAGTLAGPTIGTPGISLQVGYGGPCH
jgi:hypothetical protein